MTFIKRQRLKCYFPRPYALLMYSYIVCCVYFKGGGEVTASHVMAKSLLLMYYCVLLFAYGVSCKICCAA